MLCVSMNMYCYTKENCWLVYLWMFWLFFRQMMRGHLTWILTRSFSTVTNVCRTQIRTASQKPVLFWRTKYFRSSGFLQCRGHCGQRTSLTNRSLSKAILEVPGRCPWQSHTRVCLGPPARGQHFSPRELCSKCTPQDEGPSLWHNQIVIPGIVAPRVWRATLMYPQCKGKEVQSWVPSIYREIIATQDIKRIQMERRFTNRLIKLRRYTTLLW
jgi:hypothetical protein